MIQNNDSIKSTVIKTDTEHLQKSVRVSAPNTKKTYSADTAVVKTQRIATPKASATNSTFSLQNTVDTTALKDTTTHLGDTTTVQALIVPTGNVGVPLIKLPGNISWVFILIVVLFALLVGTLSKSRKILGEFIKSFFTSSSSHYSFGVNTFLPLETQVFSVPFFIGTVSLFVFEYTCYQKIEPNFLHFLQIAGTITLFCLAKYLIMKIVGYAFFDTSRTKYYINVYNILLLLTSIIAFPFLLLLTYHPSQWAISISFLSAVIIIFFFILLIIKLFVTFCRKMLDFLYFLLYLCILEILPLLLLFRVLDLMT